MWSSGQISNILCHLENPSCGRAWPWSIPPFSVPPPNDTSKPPPPPPPHIFPITFKPPTDNKPLISTLPPLFTKVPPLSNQPCSLLPPPKNIPPPGFLLPQFPVLPPLFLPPYKCVPPPNRSHFNLCERPPPCPPSSIPYPPPVQNQPIEQETQISSPDTKPALCTKQSESDRRAQKSEQRCLLTIKEETPFQEVCATLPCNKDNIIIIKTESFLEAEHPLNLKVEKVEDTDNTNEDSCKVSDSTIKKEVHDFLLEDSFLKSSLEGVVSIQNIQLPMEENRKDMQAELESMSLADNEAKSQESKAKEHNRQKESKKSKLHRLFGWTESPPGRRKKSAFRRSAIKCKACRSGTDAKSISRPLDQEIATCSYVILDALVDECPLGHHLDPNAASINLSTGFVTIYCVECHITIYMKNSMLPK